MSKVYTTVATYPSSSDPTKTYTVKEDQFGELSCDCKAWVFKKGGARTCKHVQDVESQRRLGMLSRVPRRAPAVPASVPAPAPTEVQASAREKGGTLAELFKRLEKESGA